jgi:hypothetical protein
MDNLFKNYSSFDEYKYILIEPLNADLLTQDKSVCHTQKVYMITNKKINYLDNKVILIKDNIICLFFIYTDFGQKMWDDKYWFFIGKLNNDIYFSYESGCSGTGFGLGSTSTIYFSKTPELLCSYGLTNKQRDLIINNIDKRFICSNDFE